MIADMAMALHMAKMVLWKPCGAPSAAKTRG